MPLVDVSGSMFNRGNPRAIDVAVSLGILFATLNPSPQYKNKFITFSNTPEFITLSNGSLHNQVKTLSKSQWDMNTNVQKAFELILNMATMFSVAQDDMPKILLILSDMQFDSCSNTKTNWTMIEEQYIKHGYTRPTIIFWNLNGQTLDYPIPHDKVPNCILISGYNDNLLDSLVNDVEYNPCEFVLNVLDNERYSCIKLGQVVPDQTINVR
jgi:hypothetical protein